MKFCVLVYTYIEKSRRESEVSPACRGVSHIPERVAKVGPLPQPLPWTATRAGPGHRSGGLPLECILPGLAVWWLSCAVPRGSSLRHGNKQTYAKINTHAFSACPV